jgi:hypothetical protein
LGISGAAFWASEPAYPYTAAGAMHRSSRLVVAPVSSQGVLWLEDSMLLAKTISGRKGTRRVLIFYAFRIASSGVPLRTPREFSRALGADLRHWLGDCRFLFQLHLFDEPQQSLDIGHCVQWIRLIIKPESRLLYLSFDDFYHPIAS